MMMDFTTYGDGKWKICIDVELLPGVVKMVLCIPSMHLLCVTMLLVTGYMSQTGMKVLSQLGKFALSLLR